MAVASAALVIELTRGDEKKHSVRYEEQGTEVLRTAYVSREALAAMDPPHPAKLRVTIEAVS